MTLAEASRASTDPSLRRVTCTMVPTVRPASNNGVYGDDRDLISGQGLHAHGHISWGPTRSLRNSGTWSGALSPTLSDTPGRFGGSDDGGSALTATQQHAVLTGLGMGVGGFNQGLTSLTLAR